MIKKIVAFCNEPIIRQVESSVKRSVQQGKNIEKEQKIINLIFAILLHFYILYSSIFEFQDPVENLTVFTLIMTDHNTQFIFGFLSECFDDDIL